jgi:glycyl-tRNA synthetase beta chain
MLKSLLVELFVEELPPKSLKALSDAFSASIFDGLKSRELIGVDSQVTSFATPRRLAVHVSNVSAVAPNQEIVQKLMPATIAIGADGKPTDALRKRLAKDGRGHLADLWPNAVDGPDRLYVEKDGKADGVFLRRLALGSSLQVGLQGALEEMLSKLPIPKEMTYQLADGWSTVKFVRPAHGLVALHGADVVAVSLLGLEAGRTTQGHRFEAPVASITLNDADSYEQQLDREGAVIASYAVRRESIAKQLHVASQKTGLKPIEDEALLDEVTSLVERPNVLVCQFESEYLSVPQECLILTMKANQKYFPLLDGNNKLSNKFLIVSNIQPKDASRVIEGNERVVRPRLADAKFFFEQDRKKPLISHLDGLARVVYHNKLGSQLDRVKRIEALATLVLAQLPNAGPASAIAEAAQLCKCDLLTNMVGEFPELQGIMGRYYALADGKSAEIAESIREHYLPRGAGDELPKTTSGMALALADKMDTIAGVFAIDQKPTGAKDPFGLRRAAIGILRIIVERQVGVELDALVDRAIKLQPVVASATVSNEIYDYIMERLRGYYLEGGADFRVTTEMFDAVVANRPVSPYDFDRRLRALESFLKLTDAQSLAAANKRIGNILKKSGQTEFGAVSKALLSEAAEQVLATQIEAMDQVTKPLFAARNYSQALARLSELRPAVDAFFDGVMVMSDDVAVKNNRLALLAKLRDLFVRVADLSRLPG